jgi:Zn-dependent M28 family amino/carboxypeptidase
MILLDMVGDRQLNIRRESTSTPWLTDIIWNTARRLGHQASFISESMAVEDDHMHFLKAGIPSVDIIDLDYPAWHTADDTLERLSPESLQKIGALIANFRGLGRNRRHLREGINASVRRLAAFSRPKTRVRTSSKIYLFRTKSSNHCFYMMLHHYVMW